MERNYKIRVDFLKQLYQIGRKVSIYNLENNNSTIRILQLQKMLEKILLHNCSIIHLINSCSSDSYKELDVSGIASIARNVMESTNLYFYTAARNIKNSEIKLRYIFSTLNYYQNITNILTKLDFSRNCFRMRMIETGKKNAIREIKDSKLYKESDKNVRNRLISGSKQVYGMFSPKILEQRKESAIYNLLSNSAHSLFIGLGSNSFNYNPIYHNHVSPLMMLSISIEICIIYTSCVLQDYFSLRKKTNSNLTNEEKVFIRQLTSVNYLNYIIDTERQIFSK